MPSPVHPYSDYGVALRTLRSARSWLGFMLVACLAAQFIGFALMWWTPQPYIGMVPKYKPAPTAPVLSAIADELNRIASPALPAAPASASAPSKPREPFFPASDQGLNIHKQWNTTYTMAVPVTQLGSLIAVSSQAIVVFVTLLVMLVAQAPGVAHITRGLIWSVLVLFMFLPWQYFARDFPIPGVIYGYSELLRLIGPNVVGRHADGSGVYPFEIWMVYGRFLVWPLFGLLASLVTAERYRAGVMIAIGHPLQSMLQPRGGAAATAAVPPSLPVPPLKTRPLPTQPFGSQV